MPESFLALSATDRRDALGVAGEASGRPPHLLEKDVWVVWALETLFASNYAEHLVFKGGTSLSKAYAAIRRFSEDVDLTYDIRALAPDLVSGEVEALPPNRSQEKKWSREIRDRLARWVEFDALPYVQSALISSKLDAVARAEGDKLWIEYASLTAGTGYVRPAVLLEFGARSTGEPWVAKPIVCDAATHLPDFEFPTTTVRVMRAERTFGEKATAIHVYCKQGRFRGAERFARHWHDITRLGESGIATLAIADGEVARAVARHKSIFFAERDSRGPIDYHEAVSGALQLVPDGEARAVLAEDYRLMAQDGLLLDEAEPFDVLMEHCGSIEVEANRALSSQRPMK